MSTQRFDERVLLEQVKLLSRSIRRTPVVVVGSAAFLVWALWDKSPNSASDLIWLFANIVWQGVRVAASLLFDRSNPDAKSAPKWATAFAVISLFTGLIFGSAGIVFHVTNDAPAQALLILLLLGMAAGSVTSTAAYWPANTAYVLPMILPVAYMQARQSGFVNIVESILLVTFAGFVIFFGRFICNTLKNAFQIGFEKEELVQQKQNLIVQLESAQLSTEQARRRAEESQRIAEAANTTKTRFLEVAAHDLQQPMTSIAVNAKLLSDQALPESSKELVQSIAISLENAQELFNSLIDFESLERGDVKIVKSITALENLMNRTGYTFRAVAAAQGLDLVFDYPKVNVFTDSAAFLRIMNNLISNAIAYTERGRILVHVKVHGDQVKVRVWDSGPGIPRKDRETVFRAFFRLHRDESKHKRGKGLGLYAVARLCELLGSRLTLRSQVKRGSVFGFQVPLGGRVDHLEEWESDSSESLKVLEGAFIMLIDDDETIAKSVAQLLAAQHCSVVVAFDQEMAIDALDKEERFPDLIICDLNLGGKESGIRVLNSVLARCDHYPKSMIYTAERHASLIREIEIAGYEWVSKSAPPNELLRKIAGKLRNVTR